MAYLVSVAFASAAINACPRRCSSVGDRNLSRLRSGYRSISSQGLVCLSLIPQVSARFIIFDRTPRDDRPFRVEPTIAYIADYELRIRLFVDPSGQDEELHFGAAAAKSFATWPLTMRARTKIVGSSSLRLRRHRNQSPNDCFWHKADIHENGPSSVARRAVARSTGNPAFKERNPLLWPCAIAWHRAGT